MGHGELMTLETRQSLEGLGLMRVALRRDAAMPLRGFTSLGLSDDEAWSLINELVKTVRLQGAMTVLERVDIKDERFAPRNTRVRMRSTGSDRAKQIISWNPSGTGTTNSRITFLRKVLAELSNDTPAEKVLEGSWRLLESAGLLAGESDRVLGQVYQVDHTMLSVTDGSKSPWYRCDTCRLVTAFSVRRLCPNSRCTGRLADYDIPAPEFDVNHYRVIYQTMNTAPLRIYTSTLRNGSREQLRTSNGSSSRARSMSFLARPHSSSGWMSVTFSPSSCGTCRPRRRTTSNERVAQDVVRRQPRWW